MRKRIGVAITWVLALVGFILTWTGLTGPELLDEVAEFQFLEFVGSDVFRTILVVIGFGILTLSGNRWHKTNKRRRVIIGQSRTPREESKAESFQPREAVVKAADDTSPADLGRSPHDMLQEQLRQAVMMKQRGTTMDSWATGVKPVDLHEVVAWENRVLELLEGRPLHIAVFTADPPERVGTLGMSAHWDPVGDRLSQRIKALESILRSS